MRNSTLSLLPALMGCMSLAGCATWGASFGFGTSGAFRTPLPQGSNHYLNLSVSSDNRVVTGVLVGILLAEGMRYYLRQDDGDLVPLERVPESEPIRRISEQDCSGVVLLDGGNLKCR